MGKKVLKLPSLFKTKESAPPRKQKHHHHHHHPWQQLLPSCGHTKTISFRAATGEDIFKTVNSVFFDPTIETTTVETPESWFTTSSESASFSTESEDYYRYHDGESLELLVRGVRSSERLLFEPGSDTSSILEKAKASGFPFKESVVLAMESEDPYQDFRSSMEEMVESHGVKDWEGLEELLCWYLRVNGKKNHGFIVGAFVDLLISLAASSSNSCSDSTTYSSAVSSLTSSPLCLSHEGRKNEIVDHEGHQHSDVTS